MVGRRREIYFDRDIPRGMSVRDAVESSFSEFDHPAWFTAVGTVLAYGAILVAMFVVVFLVPFALFYLLG
jgi:hypothetical protein